MTYRAKNNWWSGLEPLNVTGAMTGYVTGVYLSDDGNSIGVGMALTADGIKWYKKSQNIPLNNPKVAFLPKAFLKCVGIDPSEITDIPQFLRDYAAGNMFRRSVSVNITQRGAYYNVSNWKPKAVLSSYRDPITDDIPLEIPENKPQVPSVKPEVSDETVMEAYQTTSETKGSILDFIPDEILIEHLRNKGWICSKEKPKPSQKPDDWNIDPDDLPF